MQKLDLKITSIEYIGVIMTLNQKDPMLFCAFKKNTYSPTV